MENPYIQHPLKKENCPFNLSQMRTEQHKLERGFLIIARYEEAGLLTSKLYAEDSKRKRRHKRVSCLPIHSNIAVLISQETGGQTATDFSEKWSCEMSLPCERA